MTWIAQPGNAATANTLSNYTSASGVPLGKKYELKTAQALPHWLYV